jgi:CDGSH-type Zn-finger protein
MSNPDPRGPLRRILSVENKPDGSYVTCDCGHTGRKVFADWSHETEARCFQCVEETPR